ncbi:hypothetical protein BDF14DRAFT_1886435 [Spinellus fusiger]|nr:hypothetical protein BDF14DRAFT_1886435 [Spinellus fusiger]
MQQEQNVWLVLIFLMDSLCPAHLTKRQCKQWHKQQKDNATVQRHYDTPFRAMEKLFKGVFDTGLPIDFESSNDILHALPLTQPLPESVFGSRPGQPPTHAYVVDGVPGLIVINNPFSEEVQRQWVVRCVRDYAAPPHRTNIDPLLTTTHGIWPLYVQEEKTKTALSPISAKTLLQKQRWVTLGYQYNWTTKVYDWEKVPHMPVDLQALAQSVVGAVQGIGHEGWMNDYPPSDYRAEAGVINYYQYKDTLMGHVDKSEPDMEAPLVSVSFGLSCVYLLGTDTKDTPPIPIYLKSGDVLVMTGECRRAYHGVPRILKNTLPDYLSEQSFRDQPDGKMLGAYMNSTRINLNLRKVLPTVVEA